MDPSDIDVRTLDALLAAPARLRWSAAGRALTGPLEDTTLANLDDEEVRRPLNETDERLRTSGPLQPPVKSPRMGTERTRPTDRRSRRWWPRSRGRRRSANMHASSSRPDVYVRADGGGRRRRDVLMRGTRVSGRLQPRTDAEGHAGEGGHRPAGYRRVG